MTKQPGDFHILTFNVAQSRFALPLERVLCVTHYPAMARPPGRPKFLDGFVSLRGTTTPVLSLASLFALEGNRPGFYTPVVFIEAGERPAGLLADSLGEILPGNRWRAGEVEGEAIFNDTFSAIARLADGTEAGLIDPGRLLLEEERLRVADFQEQAARRLEHIA